MSVDVLDFSKLKHNPDKIKKLFVTKGNVVSVTADLEVIFPVRYIARSLAEISTSVSVINMYLIKDTNNNYAVTIAPTMMTLEPYNVGDVVVGNVLNKSLTFREGQVFTNNNNVVRDSSFMDTIYDEFFTNGKTPWYYSTDQLADLLVEAKKYTGSNLGNNSLGMEIVTAIVTRDPKNRKVQHRYIRKGREDNYNFTTVGLRNITDGINNTMGKLVGNYFTVGETSAIVTKEKKTTKISAIIRA